MKAEPHSIQKVFSFGGSIQYVLPHFQREYTWGPEQWEVFLSDTMATYEVYQAKSTKPEHFLGSLVVIDDESSSGAMAAFTLVDGQQRLTTISLLLCSLYHRCKENDAELADNIQRMLLNPGVSNTTKYKVLPTKKYGDRDAYQSIVAGMPIPNVESNIPKAYSYLDAFIGKAIIVRSLTPVGYFGH